MKNLRLPVLIIHRGKTYSLDETKRHGLVLQLATNEQIFMDGHQGQCIILTNKQVRVALRGQPARRSGSRRTAREGDVLALPGLLLSGGP